MLLSAVYTAIRVAGVVGTVPVRFADTNGYTTLHVLHPIMRTWPVPLFFRIFVTDGHRVGAHVALGALAWAWLAHSAAWRTSRPTLVMSVVFLLGATPQVTRFDNAILSESLTISVSVMLVAALLRIRGSRRTDRIVLALVWFVFVMIRPDHLVLGIVSGLLAFTVSVFRRFRFTLVAVIAMYTGLACLQQYRELTTTRDINMYTVMFNRIMADSETYRWFVEHGMPNVPGIRYVMGYDMAIAVPSEIRNIIHIPDEQDVPAIIRVGGVELARWVHTDGQGTYARWVLTHPDQNIEYLRYWADATLSPRSWGFLPTPHRNLTPAWLFGRWEWWAAASASALLSLLAMRRTREAQATCALALGTAFLYCTAILASAAEQQRHVATVAVLVRLVPLCAVSMALARYPDSASDTPTTV